MADGKQEQHWVSYANVEPIATIITIMADSIKKVQDVRRGQDAVKATSQAYETVLSFFRDKTAMRGISDVLRVIESTTPERSVFKWASNFGTSWVPNIIRGNVRETDEFVRQSRVWGTEVGGEFWGKQMQRTLWQTLPFAQPFAPPIRFDLWGQPIRKGGAPGSSGDRPLTDFLYRITSPFKVFRVPLGDAQNIDRFILSWNNRHPNAIVAPGPPSHHLIQKHGEKTIWMTDQEYATFTQASGQRALGILKHQRFDPDNPTAQNIKLIKSMIASSRKIERQAIVNQRRRAEQDSKKKSQ
jgi:hypothetical protein